MRTAVYLHSYTLFLYSTIYYMISQQESDNYLLLFARLPVRGVLLLLPLAASVASVAPVIPDASVSLAGLTVPAVLTLLSDIEDIMDLIRCFLFSDLKNIFMLSNKDRHAAVSIVSRIKSGTPLA